MLFASAVFHYKSSVTNLKERSLEQVQETKLFVNLVLLLKGKNFCFEPCLLSMQLEQEEFELLSV